MTSFTESSIEILSLDELKRLNYSYLPGPSIAPDVEGFQPSFLAEPAPLYGLPEIRGSYEEVVLKSTLEEAIDRLNPALPELARHEAFKKVLSVYSPDLLSANEAFHKLFTEGVPVTVSKNGQERGERVWLVDFQNPDKNVLFCINQYTVQERNQTKRPDIILFVNGLPLVVFELKNPADEQATVRKAFDQIQTYKRSIPSLFFYNAFCVISDGLEAKAGTLSSPFTRFQTWKTIDGKKESSPHMSQLEVLIKGMLNKATLLDLIRNFIVFEKDKRVDTATGLTQIETVKKLAAYHQYYAVNKAVESTRLAIAEKGSRKAGVIWHTQGSGKSISMVFFAQKVLRKLPGNWTFMIVTDRDDLDKQIYKNFVNVGAVTEKEAHAKSGKDLQRLLQEDHRYVFTLIQKFGTEKGQKYPKLSDRPDIIVMTDEAHRSQYDTFALNIRNALPNAAFIGFTGTPLMVGEEKTRQVFGDYVSIYNY